MRPKTAIIFDMDGVIMNTYPLIRGSWVAMGYDYPREMYGRTRDVLYSYFQLVWHLRPHQFEAVNKKRRKMYVEMVRTAPDEYKMHGPMVIDYLLQNRMHTGIVTCADPINAAAVLTRCKLPYSLLLAAGCSWTAKAEALKAIPVEYVLYFDDNQEAGEVMQSANPGKITFKKWEDDYVKALQTIKEWETACYRKQGIVNV